MFFPRAKGTRKALEHNESRRAPPPRAPGGNARSPGCAFGLEDLESGGGSWKELDAGDW